MDFARRQVLRLVSLTFGSSFLAASGALAVAEQAAQSSGPAKAAAVAPGATPGVAPGAGAERERVLGIGGFFFRSKDPDALGKWYEQHLGINLSPTSMDSPVWTQQAGQTIFTPFPETTKYFGDASKQWMLNFRVGNLQRLAAQLNGAGIEVKMYPGGDAKSGYFARIHDPEGNPIELWQPGTAGSSH